MIRLAGPLLALLLLAGCSAPSGDTSTADAPYLRLADQDDIPTLDPARGYDTASWQFEEMLFNTLVDYDDDGQLIPELAVDWETSTDGLSYTFHLRTGVRFTNGRTVVAGDIRYAIERVLDPHTQSPGAEFFRGIAGADECTATHCRVAGIDVVDAQTLRFHLQAVDPLFLHKLAMPFAAAVPAEAVSEWGEDFARHPVGSGAFRLQEWASGQRLLFVRNPDYFVRGLPRLAGVQRLVGVNDELAWLKYESRQLDVANIPPAEFPRVVREARYQPLLRHVTTMRTQYLGMNCLLPPFTDRRVRQALNFAANKTKLLQLINNRGVVAKGFVPPNMPGYNAAVPGYPFDPQRARQLLAEAGYPDGFSTTLWVRSSEDSLRLAQSLQQDFAEVGVAVRIKPIAWGPFLEAVRKADLVPMFFLGWEADFPDPSNFLEVLLHSKYIGTNNNTNYRNAEVDALLDQAARTSDPGARFALLQRAELLAIDDAPWVFLYHPVSYEIVSPRVRDFRLHPLRPARLDRVWLDDTVEPAP
jgi:ABC-type transport system substrate-binding protein